MDDGYLIHESKDHLRQCLSGMRRICGELGITLNEKKTQIVKLSHGFTFLKAKIYLTPSGKVIKKIPRMSVTRQRRKLKKLAGLTDIGKIKYEDAFASFQSWRAYAENFDAYRTIQRMNDLHNDLFIRQWPQKAGCQRGCGAEDAPPARGQPAQQRKMLLGKSLSKAAQGCRP